ncbi:zinc finger and SCAN domain-containing protein 30-like [Heteronotia binoei]|uniref:zinc finger and SCAN domain-containing protein 30-like n=1 Tax=Heteronotia binoei TaxID=13085 RepID=UPI00292F9D16|nr:zinc finger and SCAN domain-containing protein 30-like [Heteronotia binoei]
MAALNWPFQTVLQQGANPGMKIVGTPQARPPEEENVIPRVVQVGTIGEFLGCVAPQKVTQGPEEALSQCWETQWQEVLKAVQPLTFGQETQQQLKTLAWDNTTASSEVISDTGQWAGGEGSTQLLMEDDRNALQTLSNPDNGGDGTGREDTMRKEALDAEMQRRRFRQLNYRETEGPRKICGRLQELCHRWLRPERHTKEQILELVILEQFLAILPQDIQSWLRDCCPQACSHAVVLVEDFLRSQQQETKMMAPCEEDVIIASSDTEWSQLGSGARYLCGETQLEDRQDSNLSGKDRCLHVYPISPGEGTLNGNNLSPSQQGSSELPVPVEVLSGQSGWLEGRCGPQQDHRTEPPLTWEEITRCSEGVYETEVCLEEYKHWCLECGETFPDAWQLVEHQKTHPRPKRPECPKCGKSFRDLSHVIRHQTVHTGEKPYSCLECGQSFTQKPALSRHLQKHQGGFESNTPRQRSPATGKCSQCQECGKSFRDFSHVLRHQTVHTGEKPHKCTECGQGFTQKPALNRHLQKHLESKPYTAGNGELRVCQESTWFNPVGSAQRLSGTFQENASSTFTSSHEAVPQPMKKFHRDLMPRPEGNKPLKKKLNRRGQKNHWCVTCGKGFRDKADVVRHQRVHTGEKPFACPDCRRRFSTTSSLYKHRIIHRPPNLEAATSSTGETTLQKVPMKMGQGAEGQVSLTPWVNGEKH